MNKPEKECPIILNLERRFQCEGCSQQSTCEDLIRNQAWEEWEPFYIQEKVKTNDLISRIYGRLPSEEEIKKIIKPLIPHDKGCFYGIAKGMSCECGLIARLLTIAKAIHKRIHEDTILKRQK